jgi:catechol-2,3-dioxygenase
MQTGAQVNPPALMFSHFGMYCADVAKLEDFYTRVLGFAVSDAGSFSFGGADADPIPIVFMTRRPREHHQFVLAGGRPAGTPSTVGEVGFKAPNLDELRRIRDLLEAEEGVRDIVAVDHGIAWTLYFRDAEGNRVSVSVETGLYVPQPAAWPLDLDAADTDIRRATEARSRETPGSMPRKEWRETKEREYRAANRLTDEGPETGNPDPSFPRPNPDRVLLRTNEGSAPPPRIAMSSVGFKVHDLALMTEFYERVLGYAVTGQGLMPALGEEPAREYVYLSRDPDEHQQVILVTGRDLDVPSSVNQLSLRVTSLEELRRMAQALEAEPGVGRMSNTCHGNSFSLYFPDPEGNIVELAVESTWYVPAPHGTALDLSMTDDELIAWAEQHCYETPGFMMRADWKARARDELIANGHLEAEGLVSTVA